MILGEIKTVQRHWSLSAIPGRSFTLSTLPTPSESAINATKRCKLMFAAQQSVGDWSWSVLLIFLLRMLVQACQVAATQLFFPRMWPIMLKGSVLCVKLKEDKKRPTVSAQEPAQGGNTKKRHQQPSVGQKCTSPGQICVPIHTKTRSNSKTTHKKLGRSPKATITKPPPTQWRSGQLHHSKVTICI